MLRSLKVFSDPLSVAPAEKGRKINSNCFSKRCSKKSAHAPLLELFERSGLPFSLCKHMHTRNFSPGGLHWGYDNEKRFSNNRCYKLYSLVTAALLRPPNSHLLPKCFYFKYVIWRRWLDGNFPENVDLICFGLGLSPRNENEHMEFQECHQFASTVTVLLWKYPCSYSLANLKVFSRVISICTHFDNNHIIS